MSYLTLATGLIDTTFDPKNDYHFVNSAKFDENLLHEYLLGFRQLGDIYHNLFMRTLLRLFTVDKNKTQHKLLTQIEHLLIAYEPFKKMYNNYAIQSFTRSNIHEMTFNLDKMCQGDVFIYGKCVSHILNNQCNVNDFELYTMVYFDKEKYHKFLLRLKAAHTVYAFNQTSHTVIIISGIPRMLILTRSNLGIQPYIQHFGINNQLYINENCSMFATSYYNDDNRKREQLIDHTQGPLYKYFRDHYKNTNNLAINNCHCQKFIKLIKSSDLLKWFIQESINARDHY